MKATYLIILWAVLGGLWRRVFGGWSGLPRSICYALMAPLTLPIWLMGNWSGSTLNAAFAVGGSVLLSVACLMFFVVSFYPGGKFVDDRDVMLKYGPFGIGYVLAHRFWRDEWNTGSFLDGSNSVGEILLGASFWGCIGLLWIWVV